MTTILDDECLIEIPIRLPLVEIERLTRIVERARQSGVTATSDDQPTMTEKLAAFALFLLRTRRARGQAFAGIEFGEPAWDIILDLYVQHVGGKGASVSSLCAASGVPQTTALRWIEAMVNAGHLIRNRDPEDGRRVRISLAPNLLATTETFLTAVRGRALRALQ